MRSSCFLRRESRAFQMSRPSSVDSATFAVRFLYFERRTQLNTAKRPIAPAAKYVIMSPSKDATACDVARYKSCHSAKISLNHNSSHNRTNHVEKLFLVSFIRFKVRREDFDEALELFAMNETQVQANDHRPDGRLKVSQSLVEYPVIRSYLDWVGRPQTRRFFRTDFTEKHSSMQFKRLDLFFSPCCEPSQLSC